MKRIPQWMQVLEALKKRGDIATLSQLNSDILSPNGAGVNWKTKTPEATIRRIVQEKSDYFYRLKPGLYCLTERAEEFEKEYKIPQHDDIPRDVEERNHTYYQGLLVEIGKARNYKTYIPAQDKNQVFVGNQKLGDVCDLTQLPNFGYPNFMRKAKTVDVIWFNRRKMPEAMFEVEMSTDMQNSLIKFNELQDFYIQFSIVAPKHRRDLFTDRISMYTFHEIRGRVEFLGLNILEKKYTSGRW